MLPCVLPFLLTHGPISATFTHIGQSVIVFAESFVMLNCDHLIELTIMF